MKKGIVLILILSLLYQLIGCMALFSIIKKAHHAIVKNILIYQISASNLVIFKFSASNFDFQQDELIHNGHYYDIVRIEKQKEEVYVYCYDDAKETNLVANYKNIIVENITKDVDFQHKTQFIFKYFIKEFLFQNTSELLLPFVAPFKKSKSIALFLLFSSIKLPCITPPPEFYFSEKLLLK
jgi:hypothetical protein